MHKPNMQVNQTVHDIDVNISKKQNVRKLYGKVVIKFYKSFFFQISEKRFLSLNHLNHKML